MNKEILGFVNFLAKHQSLEEWGIESPQFVPKSEGSMETWGPSAWASGVQSWGCLVG